MKDGFIKVAAASPAIRVADPRHNTEEIKQAIREAEGLGVALLVLPELCVTGYTCGDLFLQERLLSGAEQALGRVLDATRGVPMLVAVGLPLAFGGKLYNCAALLANGTLLGVVPKTAIPNYNEFYEARHFAPAPSETAELSLCGVRVPFGTRLLFRCRALPELCAAVEICEDLWVPSPPSERHAAAGATVILNLSASDEAVGKSDYRRRLVREQSARLVAGYLYADAGEGESTTDVVYSGHMLIAENGSMLAERKPFAAERLVVSEIDVRRLSAERRRMTTYPAADTAGYTEILFDLPLCETVLTRAIPRHPFVPADDYKRAERCECILDIQTHGLARRLQHVGAKCAVVAVSGGLDSTLALLVAARAMDLLGRPRSDVTAVSMPGFGTTARTKSNAQTLCEELGTEYREIPISEAVRIHFRDIGQDEAVHDVTYENSQARERTQIVMDIANRLGGILVGTGDLSELALGWATYNGDHMSMYGVNTGVPKSLVRHIVSYCAGNAAARLSGVLRDILDTPVSPELLPAAENGEISQKTEDIVGPYELHDFFLYYFLRFGTAPGKLFRLACYAFEGEYDPRTIMKWQKNFTRRFFAQQFKRSCLPDGPKVGSAALSPRGDFRMPSDASSALWLSELDDLEAGL